MLQPPQQVERAVAAGGKHVGAAVGERPGWRGSGGGVDEGARLQALGPGPAPTAKARLLAHASCWCSAGGTLGLPLPGKATCCKPPTHPPTQPLVSPPAHRCPPYTRSQAALLGA